MQYSIKFLWLYLHIDNDTTSFKNLHKYTNIYDRSALIVVMKMIEKKQNATFYSRVNKQTEILSKIRMKKRISKIRFVSMQKKNKSNHCLIKKKTFLI